MYIPPPNYTQAPNDLFDKWLPLLGESELKVLLVIIRKTIGWHKVHDEISASQLAKKTGMLEETVIRAAKSLQEKGLITRELIGPNGKQRTIYALVITDNSNNSYPSVQPPPPGSYPPGSTEAQKKPSYKEKETTTIQEKEKGFAAASLSAKKEEGGTLTYLPCLDSIRLTTQEKIFISNSYDNEKIEKAVRVILAKTTPIENLMGFVRWAIENNIEPPATPQQIEKENREMVVKVGERENNKKTCRMEILTQCVEFAFLGSQKKDAIQITYTDRNFSNKINECLATYGFKKMMNHEHKVLQIK